MMGKQGGCDIKRNWRCMCTVGSCVFFCRLKMFLVLMMICLFGMRNLLDNNERAMFFSFFFVVF